MNTLIAKRKLRFKVISKTRFCIFLSAILILTYPAIMLAVDKPNIKTENSFIYVYVEKGDTLWGIAKRTLPSGTDIRDYIYEIRNINELKSANIKEGQTLLVPIYN